MRKTAKGAVTLMMCYIFLLSMLLLSLGLYSGVYQQFKRTLDNIQSSKSFWLSEGGLQCALSQLNYELFEHVEHKQEMFDVCQTEKIEKVTLTPLDKQSYRISSSSGYYTISGTVVTDSSEYKFHWLQGSWSDYDK